MNKLASFSSFSFILTTISVIFHVNNRVQHYEWPLLKASFFLLLVVKNLNQQEAAQAAKADQSELL